MTPTAPTREEAIERLARTHAALSGIDWDKQTVSGKMIWIHQNADYYDALLAMGAIREPRSIVEQIDDVTNAIMAGAKR